MFDKTARLCIAMLCFVSWNATAAEPDWSSYHSLLSSHVQPGTKHGVALMLVDYAAIKADGSLAESYRQLSGFNPERLQGRREKLAFYINAYNILAMKMVADHWPTESIKDIGTFFRPVWDKPAGELAGKTLTLGEIEHKILRPMKEPRIHLAIVCASVSCPDLRREPYTAVKLESQLDDQARMFLANRGKGARVEKKVIAVSRIFDWFEEDFSVYDGVQAFVQRYAADLPKLPIDADIPYDWSVNGIE